MAATQHYLWASGHFLLLLSSMRYLLAYFTFKSASYAWWYKTAFFGALVSYAIVCYKALGTPTPNAGFVHRALADENAQYFLLALFWWFSKPIPIALLPYVVFSLFHALTFVRTTVLPRVLPPPPPPPGTAAGAQQQSSIAKGIQSWVKANYDGAMRITALAELLILFRVVLGALTLQNSLLTPIIYAHFVRQRYYHSAFTREALVKVNGMIDGYISSPSSPPVVKQVWVTFKRGVGAWAGSAIAPQPTAGASGRRS
ncbi:hypothetical protein JB92DRAFT_3115609 [Gautieria morchelliformis]|nr:hypothetical protein JB92DRAFT_3115609 [Gautieria morchelliformis]